VNPVLDALLTLLVLAPMAAILAFTTWISYLVVLKGWRTNRIVVPPGQPEAEAAMAAAPPVPQRAGNRSNRSSRPAGSRSRQRARRRR
jgi:hypothetical protein